MAQNGDEECLLHAMNSTLFPLCMLYADMLYIAFQISERFALLIE